MDQRTKDLMLLLLYRRKITETGCWLYTGGRFTSGYGSIKYKSKTFAVHRLSLELFKGIVFGIGEQANHIKACPNKHCFNPEHLYKGSQLDNMTDIFGTVCSKCGTNRTPGKKCKGCIKIKNKRYYSRHK